MKLQVPFIQLPLRFDADLLAREIEALGEAPWRPHPQGFPGNDMLPLVAVGGDPANEAFSGHMAPTPELQRCPYLQQVFASLGAVAGRSRLMRLSGRAEVTRHADQNYYWAERMRVHVPIVTQPTVRFECGDAAVHMAAGECWIFDTWRQHRVLNDDERARIHLVLDTVGGPGFWELVARGRLVAGDRATPPITPSLVEPKPGEPAVFPCEIRNVPTVMTPWELNAHLGFLLAETLPHPQINIVQQYVGLLARQWRALWARFGDGEEGRPYYRDLLGRFLNDVREPSQTLMLRNELRWYDVVGTMIVAAAVDWPQDAMVSGMAAATDRG